MGCAVTMILQAGSRNGSVWKAVTAPAVPRETYTRPFWTKDKDYTKDILQYRKRRQEMLEGWQGLVEESGAKNGVELSAWMEEVDRLNPGLFGGEQDIG